MCFTTAAEASAACALATFLRGRSHVGSKSASIKKLIAWSHARSKQVVRLARGSYQAYLSKALINSTLLPQSIRVTLGCKPAARWLPADRVNAVKIIQNRRRFLAGLSTVAAGLVAAPRQLHAEPPPETTTVRL